MKDIRLEWGKYCTILDIPFKLEEKINPYDDTTLFCISGMQQYKPLFSDESKVGETISNIQSCLRLNDLNDIGDGSHLLYFNMIGMFSFRDVTLERSIDIWMGFITNILELKLDYVTIHPDKMDEWSKYYDKWKVEIRPDVECTWSDGEIGGYCTEFYSGGLEIGNIVNPLGTCIDVGFGLERLDMLVNGVEYTKDEILIETCWKIIQSGYSPGPQKQGYVLRKLLRLLYRSGQSIDHEFFLSEIERQEKLHSKYMAIKDKHPDKTKEWFYDTHGIDISDFE